MLKNIITILLIILLIICINNIFFKSNEGFKVGTNTNNNSSSKPIIGPKVIKRSDTEVVVGPNQKFYTYPSSPMTDLAGAIPLDFDYKDYYKTTAGEGKDLVYYYNDEVDLANVEESAYDIVNQVDKIDYGNIKTGMDKCKANCKGVCFEGGYTGTATCYPLVTQPFDWGTLYKNPTFTYGYNAWNDLDNITPS